MKFDLHVHTGNSPDCLSSVEKILNSARKRGLNGIALTDHESVWLDCSPNSALRGDIWIIRGSEVQTDIGDIVGLFIREPLRSRKTINVIAEIHEQGGLAVLAHPFKYKNHYPPELVRELDAIEVANGRWYDLRNCLDYPGVFDLLSLVKGRSAGSDSHFIYEIGKTYLEVPTVHNEEILKNYIINGTGKAVSTFSFRWLDGFSQVVKLTRYPSAKQLARAIYALTKSIYGSYSFRIDDRFNLSRLKRRRPLE